MQKLIWLALAGAAGTLARYGLAGFVHRFNSTSFPWGTVVVNLTGCFFAGVLWALFEHRWPVFGETRIIVMVGFMGAFTTFSSLILETNALLGAAQWLLAIANLILQNGLGFVALFVGIMLGRLLI
jgi:CrcB protein